MPPFYCMTEVKRPEDVIPFLGKPSLHWKVGFSAYELACRWVEANGIPKPVQETLEGEPDFRSLRIIEAIFEHITPLPPGPPGSQTDLLVYTQGATGHAVLAVEGKVEESFADLVSDWNTGSTGKRIRLNFLCETLRLSIDDVGGLRYQLLHRSAAAVLEARRYGCRRAVMLVHSFSLRQSWKSDFEAFARALGADFGSGELSKGVDLDGVELRLAWVSDTPKSHREHLPTIHPNGLETI